MWRDKNTEFYYQSAKSLFLPVEWMQDIDGFTMKLGRVRYFFCSRETSFNRQGSVGMTLNKYNTSKYLKAHGIPVPELTYLNLAALKAGLLKERIAKLNFPLVIKPTSAGLGKDVTCNIQDIETLEREAERLLQRYDFVNIEEFHGGLKSYRVLLFRKKVIGLVYREGAYVIGDGLHNIAQLIEKTNQQRAEINDFLKPIVMDLEVELCLKDQGLTLDTVPALDEKVTLGYTSNASRGGVFEALPIRQICPENRRLLVKIARLTDIELVGIDLECEDISIPVESSGGVVLELNGAPSIRIHEEPMAGPTTQVTKIMMRSLIFKHPFAYLKALYKNQKARFYVKSFFLLLLTLFVVIYLL